MPSGKNSRALSPHKQSVWPWSWVAIALTFAAVPYLVAVALTPPGKVFLGSLLNTDDTAQFLSAMRQGADGNWLYRNPFTPESARPVMMYPLYIVWGKFTHLAGLEPILAYHLLRLIGTAMLVIMIALLAQAILAEVDSRSVWKTAFLLALFSSGLSWLMLFLPKGLRGQFLADLNLIEMTTFQTFLVVPHFAWGLMLQLLSLFCFLRAVTTARRARLFWALGSGLACLGTGLVYPFALPVLYAIIGAFALLVWVTGWEQSRGLLWIALAVLVIPAPLLTYYAVTFLRDPIWYSTHVVGNTTGSPRLLPMLSGYGLVLALAVLGLMSVLSGRRWKQPGLSLLLTWFAVNGVMQYLPVPFQGRFATGWHAALSLLGALGLDWVARQQTRYRPQRVRNVILLLTTPTTMLILFVGPYMAIAGGEYPFYLSRSELKAVDWLAEHVDQADLVLSSYQLGNLIPTRASCRTFVGHQFSSYDLQRKLELVQLFFAGQTTDDQRQLLLAEYGIDLVYYGSIEHSKASFDPAQASYLQQVYSRDGVAIYAVPHREASAGGIAQ